MPMSIRAIIAASVASDHATTSGVVPSNRFAVSGRAPTSSNRAWFPAQTCSSAGRMSSM